MSRIILFFLLITMMACVQEIPIEELESESFVEDGAGSASEAPIPPIVNNVKTPRLLQITPLNSQYIAGTKSVELKVITDIKAHCRYMLNGGGFKDMNPMSKTDSLEHSHTINDLQDGMELKYQVKCAEKSESTNGFAYKYSDIKILKNTSTTLPANPPTPEITSLKFLGGVYYLEWNVDTTTVLGAPDGGFDTILNGNDLADRSAEVLFTRTYSNLDNTKRQCFQIEARWREYIATTGSGIGRVSTESCLEPQLNTDMVAPEILSYDPKGIEYSDSTTAVTITASTNEDANCRYSLSSAIEYKDMTAFNTTGLKVHTHTFTGLVPDSYQYYIRCADQQINVSDYEAPSFSIKEKVVVPSNRSLDELRSEVSKILRKTVISNNREVSCMGCHGAGMQYQSVVDLAVDIKVLEKNSKYIKFLDPLSSYFYTKVTTGTMKKYITNEEDRKTIFDWISKVDGKDVIVLNCAADEAPLDNVCVKKGKTLRSYGYRMITPDEMFNDINTIWKVSLVNKDPNSGRPIVPIPKSNHGYDNQFGLVSANSLYVNAIEEVADMLGAALEKKTDFEPNTVSCMASNIVDCGMALTSVYIPKVFRRELTGSELALYRNFFENARGTKKQVYINFFKALVQSPSFIFREEHGSGGIASALQNTDANTPVITELSLIDTVKNETIQNIPLGSSIVINTAGIGNGLSIEAKGSNIGSVNFKSTDHNQTESAAPYVFAGDDGTNIYPWTMANGEHIVEISAFSEAGGAGTQGPKTIIKMQLINTPGKPRLETLTMPDSNFTLDAYEVASRLSYFVTGMTPDSTLLAKAKNGSILQKSVREAEAVRLMQLSSSQQHLAETFMESIGIKQLAHTEALNNDMIRETRTLIRQIFFSNQKWTNVFKANYTYVNKRLADIYNLNVNTDNNNFVKVDYPDDKRSGILAHGSYLSAFYSGKDIELTKDIRRGINFYEKILCKSMPLPPPDVDVDLDPAADLQGCRLDKRKQSTTNPNGTCFQCHQHFDRIGMGFERFNNQGEYRTVEKNDNSCTTLESFYLDGATKFETMPDFTEAVSKNSNVERCLALKMKTYAYGSNTSTAYVNPIFLEMDKFKESMSFPDLIIDIVSNDEFIKRESSDEN